jgi:hypothetical protein
MKGANQQRSSNKENKKENQMENLIENLTNEQKQLISSGIHHTKFTELAAQIGCSLSTIKAYAPIAFAERAAKREAESAAYFARVEAKRQAFYEEAEKLWQAGDMEVLRIFWAEQSEEADEIAGTIVNEYVDDYMRENEEDILREAREEAEREALEECAEEIAEAQNQAFQEFLEDLKN